MKEVEIGNSVSLIAETLHYTVSLASSRWNEGKAFTCRGRHLALIADDLLKFKKEKKITPVPAIAIASFAAVNTITMPTSYECPFLSRYL